MRQELREECDGEGSPKSYSAMGLQHAYCESHKRLHVCMRERYRKKDHGAEYYSDASNSEHDTTIHLATYGRREHW